MRVKFELTHLPQPWIENQVSGLSWNCDDLVQLLGAEMMNFDLLYEFDSCNTEMSERNRELYERIHQAIRCWGYSLEDQLIVESKEGMITVKEDDDWRMLDEEFGDDGLDEIDGDLDLYVGKSL